MLCLSFGTVGLLIGWLVECSSTFPSLSCSSWLSLNILESFWQGFVIPGFLASALARISWKVELLNLAKYLACQYIHSFLLLRVLKS
ncbi:hypothetical protein MKW98_011011 [Papaver atlanticum]|uniref:Uncharacterized protein n=1 Tax=Papaver atlanticum TaxID=357466 RepID=A0AAD4TIS6_9MAGN|nr:hypothetical protein MKW98_011011 [Papaver atlanticum]